MLKFILPLLLAITLIVAFYFGLQQDPSRIPSPLLDNPAPEYELPSLKGPNRMVGSDSYAGQEVLVNIWATWCPGCRQEHGFLMELANEGNIPIYGLNWRDNRSDALEWLRVLGDPYVESAFDADGRVGIDWGAYGAPETFLVNAEGIVVHKHIAPLTREIWERDFVPLLTQKAERQ